MVFIEYRTIFNQSAEQALADICSYARGIPLAPQVAELPNGCPKDTAIAGADYPTTWVEFLGWFHSEQACRDYLEKLRWVDGLICPKCGTVRHVERMSRGRLICRECRHQA